MSMALIRFRICACLLLATAGLRAEPAVIGLARAYLGPDSTIDGIRSIHFVGAIERVNGDFPGKPPATARLDMVFVKPSRQRQTLIMAKLSETTALDGYEAWDRIQDNADPSKFRVRWLSPAEIKSLRANTWENLYFFRGMGGDATVEDKGPATIDGIACERVDFVHGGAIDFQRYFDRDTGRLVLTAHGPETIRESGEIRVDGVRFPKTIVSVTKAPSGKDIVSTVTFDSVALNEVFGPEVFAPPTPPAPKPISVVAKPTVAAPGK